MLVNSSISVKEFLISLIKTDKFNKRFISLVGWHCY